MANRNFSRRLPLYKEKLYILCEGIGDKLFLKRIIEFFESKYQVDIKECNGSGNIVSKFRNLKSVNPSINIIIFIDLDCDGENKINNIINQAKKESVSKISKKIIYFVNPMIEYLFLLFKVNKHTRYISKDDYKNDIRHYFGIMNYRGTGDEYQIIMKKINQNEFSTFVCNLSLANVNANSIPSTNFKNLIKYLSYDEIF